MSSHSLLSWCDVEKFSAHRFFQIATAIQKLEEAKGDKEELGKETRKRAISWFSRIAKDCNAIGLRLSATHALRIQRMIGHGTLTNYQEIWEQMPELRNRIGDELGEKLFMFIPSERSDFYNQAELFGKDVNARFPSIQYDILEAGNCFAAGRSTAVVFHLMRIMEVGVQEFAKILGVLFANEKRWQNLLDEINKAIKPLDSKDPKVIQMAQASANLYAVKLAWRNEVMHPKDTYTLEESDNLIRQVKLFMEHLAKVI